MYKEKQKNYKRKLSIKKAKKQNLKKKHINIFDKVPKIIELMIPDCIEEKRDYIYMGENKYSRCFVISTYPSKTYLGWLDEIFSLLRRCFFKYYK